MAPLCRLDRRTTQQAGGKGGGPPPRAPLGGPLALGVVNPLFLILLVDNTRP